ncbi:hypothetical protein LRS06_05300 [Hymenobacter sp. J193]|uniref:hypothetical protein n=1 Tax=Hymenobacter sp. J193 TaxID=2898429 RepID=UPI0021507A1F|nr:hypothetical protein [Hymenobacter sp. J193]MCR5887204.1 hypothetical protein [Hymenobacter sp. J193]
MRNYPLFLALALLFGLGFSVSSCVATAPVVAGPPPPRRLVVVQAAPAVVRARPLPPPRLYYHRPAYRRPARVITVQ